MILMGDRGIPDGYRFMHGYSGHTHKLVNKDGSWVYAQIHMKSQTGCEVHHPGGFSKLLARLLSEGSL